MKNVTVLADDQAFKLTAFYHLYKFAVEETNGTYDEEISTASLFHLNHKNEVLLRSIAAFAGTIVSCFGILGNFFSILVLARRKMRSPIAYFLIGLAVSDMLFLLYGSFVWNIPNVIAVFDPTDGKVQSSYSRFTVRATPLAFTAAMAAQAASILFTIAVTVERYIAVCHPFKARVYLTCPRAWKISAGIVVISTLYNLPRYWEYDVAPICDTNTLEIRGYVPVGTTLIQNLYYNIIYRFLAYLILYFVIPLIMLIVLNILIYSKVRSANEQRQSLSSSQRHENSLAVMLLVVVCVFIVCNILPLIESLIIAGMGLQESMVELESLRNFLVIFNSSVNFVIYCFYGEKFREIFLEMLPGWIRCFCCCCPKLDEKQPYWAESFSDGSTTRQSRLSHFKESLKSLRQIDIPEIFITHI